MSANNLKIRRFNREVSMRGLLMELKVISGIETSCYCPFHMDRETGHRSASVSDARNTLYCFSEQRMYRPYDCLKLLGKVMEEYDLSGASLVEEEAIKYTPRITKQMEFLVRKKVQTLEQVADELRKGR